MISRSPAPARPTPPETGASTSSTSCSANRSAQLLTGAGPTVAMTTTAAPGSSAAAAESSPKSTPSTWSAVATISTRTSAPVAASVIVAAGTTPSPASVAARAGSMSNAVVCVPGARHAGCHRRAHGAQADPSDSQHHRSFAVEQQDELLGGDVGHGGDDPGLEPGDVVTAVPVEGGEVGPPAARR